MKENGYTFRGGKLFETYLSFSEKVYCKRKEVVPFKSRPFLEEIWCEEEKQRQSNKSFPKGSIVYISLHFGCAKGTFSPVIHCQLWLKEIYSVFMSDISNFENAKTGNN